MLPVDREGAEVCFTAPRPRLQEVPEGGQAAASGAPQERAASKGRASGMASRERQGMEAGHRGESGGSLEGVWQGSQVRGLSRGQNLHPLCIAAHLDPRMNPLQAYRT